MSRVLCDPSEHNRLIDCEASRNTENCDHRDDAGVRCFQSRVTDINVTTVNGPSSEYVTALITWETQNTTVHIDRITSYVLVCHSESHRIEISLSNQTMLTRLGGILHSSSYKCCISEVYDRYYFTRSVCTVLNTTSSGENMVSITTTGTDSTPAVQAFNSSNTIEWALGGIIIVLLIFLVLLVIAIVCLLRPGLRKKVLPTK